MALSIEEMRALAFGLRKEGLNSQQIADELSLSQDTISWLLTEGSAGERPTDVRIGWRSIGVRPERIAAIGTIMADIADEELGASDIDTIVGISINGISFAHEVARCLGSEYTIYRNVEGDDGHGVLSNKYGQVSGKKVVIIDDVLSSGTTLGKTIESIRAAGGEVGLAIVLINKTTRNEVDGVPLRAIIRAVAV
ncbi:MAG: orotate phosphoribosyltransferase-like protein [Euryarchaeota archaeon]|jgi:orotate phosphoribosyltransferase|nr:orotate phosphoribosyltransferase-like protein [Euryarchaeota archaeon]MBT5594633.1 orotate phosphoribosyltransferase-like protein [Euryarchaeota archaeon]MBT6845439.1 orotate phosphoribosyltransferase-like protein [Euryarchaeota archaeon]MBT7064380.1 orotate phosphoribosyltransferase-like protein [Euryarchaeota archaeon]MBT7263395.1 orotate phosphoribosyltransferase-like protein [Euryarchaeota archaeon]